MSGPDGAASLAAELRARLAGEGVDPRGSALGEAVRGLVGWRGTGAVLTAENSARADLLGLGPLEPLLADPQVSDVCVNAPDEVWVDSGEGLRRADVRLPSAAAVRELAVRLVEAAGRRLDDAHPFADARLPGGLRLHAALPPVAPDGPLLSLRTGRRRAFELAELVDRGTVDRRGAALLEQVVRSRANFLVSGGAGSGKTTLLSALLSLADPAERVVLVEDVGELRPRLPHVVRLECRPANAEGAGEVRLERLVREALRMRPDRLVVGECRGVDVVELLSVLNTGVQGGAATVHANRLAHVPARLEALAALAGLPRAALHSQLGAAVAVAVHLVREGPHRRVSEVGAAHVAADGTVSFPPAWRDDGGGFGPTDSAGELAARLGGWP